MVTGLLQRLHVLSSTLSDQIAHIDVAPPPTDIPQPPTEAILGLGAGVLAALCCLVVVMAVVAFFVIRAIKKNRVAREAAAPAQNDPTAPNS